MRVEISMTSDENKLMVNAWWATSPEFVIESIKSQLAAAQTIWPELKRFRLDIFSTADEVMEALARAKEQK